MLLLGEGANGKGVNGGGDGGGDGDGKCPRTPPLFVHTHGIVDEHEAHGAVELVRLRLLHCVAPFASRQSYTSLLE